jgi:hypothetical protein
MSGVNVKLGESTRRGNTTDVGRVFVIGQTTRGPIDKYIAAGSLKELVEKTGVRLPAVPWVFDGADFFFRERGAEIIFARLVGATPVAASLALKNAAAETTMNVKALEVGEWGNELKLQIIVEGAKRIYVVTLAGVEVERSPALETETEAVAWSQESKYIRLVDVTAVAGPPVVLAATSLAGGTEDASHITVATAEAAEALLLKSLGSGNMALPGVTSTEILKAMMKRADEKERTLLEDGINTSSAATIIAGAAELKGKPGAKRSAVFTPWGTGPGLAPGLPDRVIPYSMVQAGIIARNDGSKSPPPVNEPSAGDNGVSLSLTGLAVQWTDAQRDELDAAGVNPVIVDPDDAKIKCYGDNTLAGSAEPAWKTLSAARLFMLCASRGRLLLKPFYKKPIDPGRALINRAAGVLQSFLEELAAEEMLFNDPTEAVNVADPVNTEETIQNEELNAVMDVKPTPKADSVNLEITAEAS